MRLLLALPGAAAAILAAALVTPAVAGAGPAACRHHQCPSPSPSPSPTLTTASPSPSPSPTPTATSAGTLVNRPAQAASIVYGAPGTNGQAIAYARPGGLVVAGRDNYADQVFRDISAGGGTELVYLDTIISNPYGRYESMLLSASACGAAVPAWPGNYAANGYFLNDFRPGGIEQSKLHCVLETMVAENPQMAGWFADDLGSRSWFGGFSWGTFPDQQGYRDGAIAIARTFRQVADEHGLIFIVNGTWGAGTLAAAGGGYPDMNQHGLSLADGGFAEHHALDAYWTAYGCSAQWASGSAVTHGTAFSYAVTNTTSDQTAYVNSGCYAYVNTQTSANYDYAPPWGTFHPTGLPSRATG
jgi:hypothetical protein